MSPEVILVQVDIKANNERLVELTKQLNENRTALKALSDANKAGTLSADDLAAGQVRLKQTTANIGQEMRTLTKANAQQDVANKAATGSTEQLRIQYQQSAVALSKLSQEERDNTASGQKLQAQTKALNDEISKQEQAYGQFGRNVGNYAGSIGPLIQELVKLQEQQKTIPEGTAAYAQAQAKVIGFQQAVNNAGVKAGLTYEQTQAKVAGYGAAIAPVTAKLVQLEGEQKKVGEGSKEYAKIGFQIGAVKKELEKIPETAVKTSDSLKTGFQSALSQGLSPFKNQLEQGSGLLGKFRSGSDLVTQGMSLLKGGGETGALGLKAIAGGIALTGIGLFVLALTAVVTYFAQTAEGGKILAGVMGGLGAVLQVATDAVTNVGKALVNAFSSPKEAAKDLLNFLENNILNRFKAFGVILDALNQRDFKGVANGMLQLGTGVVDVVGKVGRLGSAFNNAAKAGQALVLEQKALIVARRELEIEDVKEQSRVAVLLRLSKERGKSAGEQLAALKEAGRLEAELTDKNIKLQEREAAAIRENIRQKGEGKAADLKAELGAKEKEIAQTLASQDETNAKIRVRESVFREKQRTEAAAAALTQRQDAVKSRQTQVEQELLQVAKGSAAELVLLQRKIDLAAALVLASEKKTAADRELLLSTAEAEKKALQEAFNQKAIEAAKKHTADTVAEANREYAEAQKALEDYLNTQRAAVELDRAAGKTSEFEYKKQLNDIEKAGNAAALVNAKDYGKESGAIQKKDAADALARINLLKDEKKRIADVENNIQQASLQAASATSDLIIDGFGKESAAGQVALAAKKVFALAEIAINLQRQLSANALYGATLGPLGLAYITATDALAIAGALASAAKIAGFAQGGYVSGAGTGTSDSIPARLSNGESVMNANTTARFGGLLSHLNVLGGGVAFATGGLVPGSPASAVPINDGGLLARQLGGAAPALDYPTLIKAIADYGNFEITGRQIERTTARREFPRAASTLG